MATDSTHTSYPPSSENPEGIYRALLYLEGQARQAGLTNLAGLIRTAAEEARGHCTAANGKALDN